MSLPDLDKLKSLVKDAAHEILMKDFGCSECEYKEDGSAITAADLRMQEYLVEELNRHWPEYRLLGEEMTEAQQQSVVDAGSGYWCVDPLDGTTNYAASMPFFGVSVALVVNNEQQLGLVYDPVRDEMFSAVKGQGAYLNDRKLVNTAGEIKGQKPVVAEIDLKRLPKSLAVRLITESIFASQRNIGSSALDWCWLAAGRYDIYLHGGQKLWDYAAGHMIFTEAGGYSTSLDGDTVFRGKLEKRSVLASFDKTLFDYWHQWIEIPFS